MAYPQTIDVLNFSNTEFNGCDYQILQTSSIAVFVIGAICTQHGLLPYINRYTVPKVMGNNNLILCIIGNHRVGRLTIILLTVVVLTFGFNQ